VARRDRGGTGRLDQDAYIAEDRPYRQVGVFIICGPRLIAGALAALLAQDHEITVLGTGAGSSTVAERLRESADVVVLYGVRSSSDATDQLTWIHAARLGVRVLVLTPVVNTNQGGQIQLACIRAGAVGCLDEDSQPEELLQAVKRVHAGEVLVSHDVLSDLLDPPRRSPRGGHPSGGTPALPPRERQVLQAFAAGMTTEEVADALTITVQTVRTHSKNIIAKLGARSKLDAVMIALRRGLIDRPE